MRSDPDWLFKRVWLINGFLVLAGAGLAIALMLFVFAQSVGDGESGVHIGSGSGSGDGPPRPRAVRYGEPERIRGTSTQLVLIDNGEGDEPMGAGLSGSSAYMSPRSALVNVVFIDSGKPAGRLLLDRPAFIESVRYPGAGYRSAPADSLQPWISYEIALADTDGDGALDRDDAMSLYVSALDGTGFRRATPEGVDVSSHAMRPDRRSILVLALESPAGRRRVPDEQRRQRAYIYDVATGSLAPWTALEEPAARAARIVGR